MGLVALIEKLGELGCEHGVGIVDHIEDRIVGLQGRDIYEVPAATILLAAHKELEKLVCTSHQNLFKAELDNQWGFLAYAGLWWEPLRGDLDSYMESVNAQVTGKITVKLFKGSATAIKRTSPNAVYDAGTGRLLRVRWTVQPAGEPRIHRTLDFAEHGWPTKYEAGKRPNKHEISGKSSF